MNAELLDDEVRESILSNLDLCSEPDFEEGLRHINNMTTFEAFNRYLNWHGIIGYTDRIIQALDNIRAANQTNK